MNFISLALWSERSRQRKDKDLQYLIDFLRMHYIIDDFETDHTARIQWINELSSKYKGSLKYLRRHALRGNLINGLNKVHNFNLGYLGTNPDELRYESSQILMPGSDYMTWSTERKIEFVFTSKGKLYGFLKFLSEQSPASS